MEGKKFDLKLFIGIVSVDPLILVYFDGYTTKSLRNFTLEVKDKFRHFTSENY